MDRAEVLQEVRRMRFEEISARHRDKRLSAQGAQALGASQEAPASMATADPTTLGNSPREPARRGKALVRGTPDQSTNRVDN